MKPRWLKYIFHTFFIFFIFFIILSFVLAWGIQKLKTTPMLSDSTKVIIIEIKPNDSAYQLSHTLKKQKLISSEPFLRLLIRFEGVSHQLKAGIYKVKPNETAWQFIQRIVAGDVLTKNFSIIEGTNVRNLSVKFANAEYLYYEPSDWNAVKDQYNSAEGLLLADTYQYQAGSNSKIILKLANKQLKDFLNACWQNRDKALPYKTPYEMLIAASIIEKETSLPEERPLISGVIINRLKKRMRLQMDPTVIYALGDQYKGKLTKKDLQVNSPFNTYLKRGLPPTPIAMVGKESIKAAAHPAKNGYYYFVAKGDGSHQFSETYEQQRTAIERFQKKEQ